jgi:hypothetical protein
VSNPGFEVNLAGWQKSSGNTTLARTCTVAHTGACSANLGRTHAGEITLDDAPDTVARVTAGAIYTASAWVRAPAGRTVRLRVRERSGGSSVRTTVATLVGDGTWRRLTVATPPAVAGRSLGVEIVVSLARNSHAQVDDVSLRAS